jgi:hypothetical protein|tara:strand:- start:343 stop:825 length:483 start_codon:yes stop_codon:yes gene_type:complete
MKDPNLDQIKSDAEMRKAAVTKCEMPGCDNKQSMYRGTGSIYCREHQLKTADRGGYGKMGRDHTFHRDDVCECCRQNITEDPRWEKAFKYFGINLPPDQMEKTVHEVKRRYMHGDHQIRTSDGGDSSGENIKNYCPLCHWIKTVLFDDGRIGELIKEKLK